jgi:hypothetical protein
MQKIFYVHPDYQERDMRLVHEFIESTGKIISVTRNDVSGTGGSLRGGWLVVAENETKNQ